LTNCPFKASGTFSVVENIWIYQVQQHEHNHELSLDPSGFPRNRRLTEGEVDRVKELVTTSVAPRQILSILKKSPTCHAIHKTIYNLKGKLQKEELAGRSVLEALYDELIMQNFEYSFENSALGELQFFLFTKQSAIDLLKDFNRVILLDCTYKTNRYIFKLYL
jgi:hypothetical protein